jgi:hypothetical protein
MQNYLNIIPNYVILVKNSIQISKRKILLRLDSFEKPYKQLELVFHRDIQTLENNVWKHSRFALVVSYIVFSCLDISVKHSLSLFIYRVYKKKTQPRNFPRNRHCFKGRVHPNSRMRIAFTILKKLMS